MARKYITNTTSKAVRIVPIGTDEINGIIVSVGSGISYFIESHRTAYYENLVTKMGLTSSETPTNGVSYLNIDSLERHDETSTDIAIPDRSNIAPAASLKTVTTEASIVAVENVHRLSISIQNISTVSVLVSVGSTASSTNFNFILAPDTDVNVGNGSSIEIKDSTCYISAVTLTGTSKLSVCEVSYM